jgi:hypothetical protein
MQLSLDLSAEAAVKTKFREHLGKGTKTFGRKDGCM